MNFDSVLRKPINGHELDRIINNPNERRQPLVESLIYERTSCMFVSQPGMGKSFLSLQMSLEMSAGLPVFGSYPTTRPVKVYYIQKERPVDEIAERVEVMQKQIPWNRDNLIIDSGLQSIPLTKETYIKQVCERIRPFAPDVIWIDPIGAGSPGLSSDDGGNIFALNMTYLENELGVSILCNHHETKPSYDRDGKMVNKEDSFYGSQWIKAWVQSSYKISGTDDGRLFEQKKSNASNSLKQFQIAFDAEEYLSSAKIKTMSNSDSFSYYAKSMLSQNKQFKLSDAEAFVGCDTRTLRRILDLPFNKKNIKRHKSSGHATLYEVLPSYLLS